MIRNRRQQVAMLHRQALRGQRLLEAETAVLTGELKRLQEARQTLGESEAVGAASTAGLQGNATRHRELVTAQRRSLAEETAAVEQRLIEHQARLRQAAQAVSGWELLAERLTAQERGRLARLEQEIVDQHGQWRSRRSG
jgi:hypothetical protein